MGHMIWYDTGWIAETINSFRVYLTSLLNFADLRKGVGLYMHGRAVAAAYKF